MSTTQIIQLESAQHAPVLQTRKAGRLPKSIGNMQEQRKKTDALNKERCVIEGEIQATLRLLELAEITRFALLEKLGKLRNPRLNSVQRSELAAEIERNNLPESARMELAALRRHVNP